MKVKILFVCLGNICRSPSAEGVAKHIIEEKGWQDLFEIDSAGLHSYHAGELPDPRMRETAQARGYDPVSYTHLDVYKRQCFNRAYCCTP